MGGYIGWQFVRKYPQRVGRLVLCDTRAAADSPEAARGRETTAQKVLAHGAQVVADAMLPKLVCDSTRADQPQVVDAVRQTIERTDPTAIAAALRGMAVRPDVTSMLPGIKVPTLVLVGEEDAITPAAEMKAMAAAIPGAHFVVIPAAGHLSPLENPQVFNRELSDFLAK
jgi:pimeloyl-ACP methyl ester carboxylesterase